MSLLAAVLAEEPIAFEEVAFDVVDVADDVDVVAVTMKSAFIVYVSEDNPIT